MGWKVVHLTKPCKIKIKNENFILSFSEEEVHITLKDIDFILFDSTQFSITGKSLGLLAKNNIATLFIDEHFHPSSILTPYHSHSTMTEIAYTQISLTTEFKAQVWQDIIKSKIKNQAKALEFFENKIHKELEVFIQKVQPYDKNNDEAQSARLYWKHIFEIEHFRREQGSEDILNSMLNYSYAILRSLMARSVSASGLLPVFGIWHQNKYNAFNLVDDLIEPFRAICDLHVKIISQKYQNELFLNVTIKRELVALLNIECIKINNGITSLSKAIEIFLISYKKAMLADDSKLIFYPSIYEEVFQNECV